MVKEIKQEIKNIKEELIELNEFILENPELGHEEYKSSQAHEELLEKHGFEVESEYLGIETSFRAEFEGDKEGPTIAYLAEYDALPDIGHGCAHNLLGTVSTGAAIVLSQFVDEIGGKVVVIGTPAEETSGAKVDIVEGGGFEDIDIALIAHPADGHYKSGSSLALEAMEFIFKGKTAHAAASPEKGINALDAAINMFNNINALREHIRDEAKVHGIIKEGGTAANVVPERAVNRFYIREVSVEELNKLREKIINCAKGASLAAGTELEYDNYEATYHNMITNQKLSNIFTNNLKKMGVDKVDEPSESTGSIDMGNVSQVCPAIHPYFAISTKELTAHTAEFRDESKTPYAYEQMEKTIGALVMTAREIIEDEDLLKEIYDEFEKAKK